MATTKVWTQALEQNLIELWQQHECLYDVANEMYHNRAEKEKRWAEVANALQQPVEEVKTRAVSLRTQFVRLVKPKPSGSDNKPLTPRQRWLLRAMGFIKKYVSHRPCETTVCVSFSEQDDAEDRPDTPSAASTSSTASSLDSSDEGTNSAAVEETASPASTDSRNTQMESSSRRVKRKWRSETDIELQKLVLKQIASKGAADPTADAFTTFGNQVASELRLIQDPAYLIRLKRNIMNMIYDTQDSERNRSFSSHAPPTPYTFQPVILSPVKVDECACKEEEYETQITVKCEHEEEQRVDLEEPELVKRPIQPKPPVATNIPPSAAPVLVVVPAQPQGPSMMLCGASSSQGFIPFAPPPALTSRPIKTHKSMKPCGACQVPQCGGQRKRYTPSKDKTAESSQKIFTYCPATRKSTTSGFEGVVFNSFEHFKSVVDEELKKKKITTREPTTSPKSQ